MSMDRSGEEEKKLCIYDMMQMDFWLVYQGHFGAVWLHAFAITTEHCLNI